MEDAEMEAATGGGESFVHKVGLLVITGMLSGVLIPLISSVVTNQQAARAEEEAAQKAREASVIRAQEEFLVALEQHLFAFNMRAAALPWYRTAQADPVKFAAARDAYDAESWKFWGHMLVLMSKGKRLTSPAAFKKLKEHEDSWLALDDALVQAMAGQKTDAEWQQLLDRVNAQADASAEVLDVLAKDYGLGRSTTEVTAKR